MWRTNRNMPGLGLCVALAVTALAAQPATAKCVLAAEDFGALQLSKSAVKDQGELDALPPERQKMLCSTRVLWKKVRDAGQLPNNWADEEPGFSPAFMSPDELKSFTKLEDAWMDAQLAADQARQARKPGPAKAH